LEASPRPGRSRSRCPAGNGDHTRALDELDKIRSWIQRGAPND
jgi:hypothetical protein